MDLQQELAEARRELAEYQGDNLSRCCACRFDDGKLTTECLQHAKMRQALEAAEKELKIWKPWEPDEVEEALDAMAAEDCPPLTESEIDGMVAKITDPAYRPTEPEYVKLLGQIQYLEKKVVEANLALDQVEQTERQRDAAIERLRELQVAALDERNAWGGKNADRYWEANRFCNMIRDAFATLATPPADEWPVLRAECRDVLAELAALRARLAEAERVVDGLVKALTEGRDGWVSVAKRLECCALHPAPSDDEDVRATIYWPVVESSLTAAREWLATGEKQ